MAVSSETIWMAVKCKEMETTQSHIRNPTFVMDRKRQANVDPLERLAVLPLFRISQGRRAHLSLSWSRSRKTGRTTLLVIPMELAKGDVFHLTVPNRNAVIRQNTGGSSQGRLFNRWERSLRLPIVSVLSNHTLPAPTTAYSR
ncbi:hypothetical protein J6590_077582 [Homalodisca vitripennis]|nr:hypothetical protein J6590_077579 [Homalodisca vitripennis]KAG8285572.1 hypothetical protein J6590_077582 [Homalodisca vitripennis]